MAFSAFGKSVKKRLVDLDQTQAWLADEVTKKTGLYMDSGYMNKLLRGIHKSPKVISAICEILSIPDAPTE